jgi:hypothetical protein
MTEEWNIQKTRPKLNQEINDQDLTNSEYGD